MKGEKYPYFVAPMLKELKRGCSAKRAEELKAMIAVNVGDPDALRALVGTLSTDLREFYADRGAPVDTTEETIDSFLTRFGGDNPLPAEGVLAALEEEPKPEKTDDTDENSLEKVKVLVKNKEYGAALEIMEAIYLNNPKKSIYFADQIRFIKKMLLISENNR